MDITLIVYVILAATLSAQALTDDDNIINCPEICKSVVYRRLKAWPAKCNCLIENESYLRYKQMEDSGIYFEPTDLYTLQRLSIDPPFYILNPALKLDFPTPNNVKKRRLSHSNKEKKSSSSLPTDAKKRSLYLDIDVQGNVEIGRTASLKGPFELSEKDFMECVNVYTSVYSKAKNIQNIKHSEKDTLSAPKRLSDIVREKCSQSADVVRQSLRQITNTWRHPQISSPENSELIPYQIEAFVERKLVKNAMVNHNVSKNQDYEDELSHEISILSDRDIKNVAKFPAFSERSSVESDELFVTEYSYVAEYPSTTPNILHKRVNNTNDTSGNKDTLITNHQYPSKIIKVPTVSVNKESKPEFHKYLHRSGDSASPVAEFKNKTDEYAVQSNSSRTNLKYLSDVITGYTLPEHIKKKKTSNESVILKNFTMAVDPLHIPSIHYSVQTERTEIIPTNYDSTSLNIKLRNQVIEYTTSKYDLIEDYTEQTVLESAEIATQQPENVNKIARTLENSILNKEDKNEFNISGISSDETYSTTDHDLELVEPKFILQYSNEIPREIILSKELNMTGNNNLSAPNISDNPRQVALEIENKHNLNKKNPSHSALNVATKSVEDFTENNKNKSIVTRSTATTNLNLYDFETTISDDDINGSVTSLLTYPIVYEQYSNSMSPSSDRIATSDDVNGSNNQFNFERHNISGDVLTVKEVNKDKNYKTLPFITEQILTTDDYQQKIDTKKYTTTENNLDLKNDNSSESVLISRSDVRNLINITEAETNKDNYYKIGIMKDQIINGEYNIGTTEPNKDVKNHLDDINISPRNNFSEDKTSHEISINNYVSLRHAENMTQQIEFTGNITDLEAENKNQQIENTDNTSVTGNLFFIFNKTNIPAKFIQKNNGELSIGIDGATLCTKLNRENSGSFLINVICNCFLYDKCTNLML